MRRQAELKLYMIKCIDYSKQQVKLQLLIKTKCLMRLHSQSRQFIMV